MNQGSNQQPASEDTRLSIGKAAKHLGISIDTLRRWEKKGRIIAYRSPGGHRYFLREDLDNLFGKKYTREETKQYSTQAAPTSPTTVEVPPSQPTQVISQQYTTPPAQTEAASQPQNQPVKPVAKYEMSESDKQKLSNILSSPTSKNGQKKYSFFTKLVITGVVLFSLVDIVLVIMYFTSPSLITPLP